VYLKYLVSMDMHCYKRLNDNECERPVARKHLCQGPCYVD
jgi:hypothetical protein